PAADDDLLLAAGQMQKALSIEEALITGLCPSPTADRDGSVIGEIAVVIVREATEVHRSNFSAGQRASFGIDDLQTVVGKRRADGARPPLLARTSGDPTDLAAAVALADADAELPFEAFPLLEWKRCRARGDETQRRHVGRAHRRIRVEQHADRGRIAGGGGRVILLDVIGKPAAG